MSEIRIRELEQELKDHRIQLKKFKDEIGQGSDLSKIIAWSLLNNISIEFQPASSDGKALQLYSLRFRHNDYNVKLQDFALKSLMRRVVFEKEHIFCKLCMKDILENK